MLPCKQNLSFEIKVGVHIYLGTFQCIADVAHRIVSGCTPPLYHCPKVPFALCLAYVLCGTFITYQTNTLSAAIFEMPNTPAT